MTSAAETVASGVGLASTLCEMFDHTVRRWPDTVALRTVDEAQSYTYAQYRAAVVDIAAALHGCGVGAGDVVVLMFENRPLFHIVDAAVMHLGAVTCSVYNTSPVRDIEHVFRTSGARIALCESKFATVLRAGGPDARIVCDSSDIAGTEWLNDLPRSADFDFDARWKAIEPDAALTLIYTSGTTGTPKAVELTHRSMAAEVLLAAEALDFRAGDRVPSALPMAHAAQRWGTHYNAMAFGLEVVCIDDISKLATSLAVIEPNIWGTVPRVLEKLVAGLSSHIDAEADATKKSALAWALDVGRRFVTEQQAARNGSGPGPNEVLTAERERAEPVLTALRARIGLGQLRWLMVGAAPTPPHVLEFLAGLGLEIIEVWGMSELGSVATVNPIGAQKLGTVGKPLRTVEIDIADDGEVLVRGPILMRGYRGDPERTAETFDSAGRFKTGDVGQLDEDGYLTITDRKKEIIVNAAGKNISPARVEAAVKAQSPLISTVMAIGDGRPYLTALIVLDPETVAQFAADNRLTATHFDTMVESAAIRVAVAGAVDRANQELARVEQIKRYVVLTDVWLPGGDELTPTLKVRRRVVAEKYGDRIASLYEGEASR